MINVLQVIFTMPVMFIGIPAVVILSWTKRKDIKSIDLSTNKIHIDFWRK